MDDFGISWIFHYHEHYHNKFTYNLYWELIIECCPSLHSVQSTLSKHVKNALDRESGACPRKSLKICSPEIESGSSCAAEN